MTIGQLHDALNLLPSDLVAATDRLRSRPKKPAVNYNRWISLAACLAILIGSGFIFRDYILPGLGGTKEMALQAPAAAAPAESPAAQAPAPEYPAADNALSEESASEKWDEVPAMEAAPSENKAAGSSIDGSAHQHSFAADAEPQESEITGADLIQVTLSFDGMTYSLSGEQAGTITDILVNLPYDSAQTCRCMAEYQVDTQTLTGIDVSLTEGFARCELGQASLTEAQTDTLREIFESLAK